MRIPILSERVSTVIHRTALVLVAALPLLAVRAAADPYQPARALAVGVAGLLVALTARRTRLPRGRWAVIAAVALGVVIGGTILAALVSGAASAVFGVHGRFQGLVSGTAALCALAIGVLSVRHARTAVRWLAVLLAVQAGIVVAQRLAGLPPAGTVGNTVLVGGWLAVGTAAVAGAARSERGRAAGWLWAAAAAGALALGLVGSRGAWVGLVAGAVPLVMAAGPTTKRLLAPALVGLVVVGALIGGAASSAKLDPAMLAGGSAGTRLAIWEGTFAMIGDHPLLGTGPGRFLYAFAPYQTAGQAAVERGVRPDQAHSLVLHTAAESGVPVALAGVVLAGAALGAAGAGFRRRDAASLIALAGLAAWAGQGLFGIATVETDALAMVFAGFALAGTGARDDAGRRPETWMRIALGVIALVLVGVTAVYLRADVAHRAGVVAFTAGDMEVAWERERAAVERNGLVDIYRVGAVDAVLYGAGTPQAALGLLERGLALEPASYDLAIARARLLARDGATPDVVLKAYLEAVRRYPLGIEVNHEAIGAAQAAGRPEVAARLAEDMLVVYPDDPIALDVLGKAASGS